MPTYAYKCKSCEYVYEKKKKFSDPHDVNCPSCEVGEVRRVINQVGVVFKGSGFYVTDNRGKKNGKSASSNGKKDEGKAETTAEKSESSTADKADKKADKPEKSTKKSAEKSAA